MTLVYGQMNEPPGARARVALTGLTVAEYFRDEEGQDVLLFVDNIFRFTQVGWLAGEEGADGGPGGGVILARCFTQVGWLAGWLGGRGQVAVRGRRYDSGEMLHPVGMGSRWRRGV